MTQSTVTLTCDDCSTAFYAKEFASSADARVSAAEAGWRMVRVFRVELDFCPECQQDLAATVTA